ncbi:MAG: aldose epimerase family protein [Bacillus sp. (in: firmicutes)]
MNVLQERFGQINNQTVNAFTLINDQGIEITCINYGCIITRIVTPDQNDNYENIVLGYDTIEEYIENNSFFGAVCGRIAGRVKGAAFELDGQEYSLAKNDNGNHLHGGIKGFDKVVWDGKAFKNEHEIGVEFTYASPDGEEGYPGNLTLKVIYSLNNRNELTIQYAGRSDKKTLLNVTNHSYFNLSGNLKRDILNHSLTIKSDKYLELDAEFIPTGNLLEVDNGPFDFKQGRQIKTGIVSNHPQNVLVGEGYDHPFLLSTNHEQEIFLKDPESGRTLTIETDEAGVVVYSGNSLSPKGEIRGVQSRKYLGICLETQGLPDAIHHPQFPTVILEKDEDYFKITKYKFGIEKKEIHK